MNELLNKELERYKWAKYGMMKDPEGEWFPWTLVLEILQDKIETEMRLNKYIHVYGPEI